MHWRSRDSAWFGLGSVLAFGVIVTTTLALKPTTASREQATKAAATLSTDVVEPASPTTWPPMQRPKSMAVPEEESQSDALRPGPGRIVVRRVQWDPDSAEVPSLARSRPTAPKWDPNTAVAPSTEPRFKQPERWDPNSPVPPILTRR